METKNKQVNEASKPVAEILRDDNKGLTLVEFFEWLDSNGGS